MQAREVAAEDLALVLARELGRREERAGAIEQLLGELEVEEHFEPGRGWQFMAPLAQYIRSTTPSPATLSECRP